MAHFAQLDNNNVVFITYEWNEENLSWDRIEHAILG